ncbi:pseudouridine synthase [Anaerolentibacter hominis]|uniref:pseudouridine synthase n=1 Tax=Anaerolentibacter hominis TaxID=3079009 RepID=UPI0031B86E38
MEKERLNKYLSAAGVCSRREADRMIAEGKVTVDGKPAVLGTMVHPGQNVVFCGKPVVREEPPVLLAFNKPRGIVCTTDSRREKQNVIDYIQYPVRIYPVGRLDKDSEGLLLLTNQGEWMDQILRGRNGHEKEYMVTVDKEITGEFIKKMSGGVPILDTVTRSCTVEKCGRNRFRIVLTQGLNRQIRRMCEYLGYRVVALKRVRIMNVKLGSLKTGEYREVTGAEIREMKRLLKKQ